MLKIVPFIGALRSSNRNTLHSIRAFELRVAKNRPQLLQQQQQKQQHPQDICRNRCYATLVGVFGSH